MAGLWQDLRYAARSLARAPGFLAVAVLSLALGIGANLTNFSLANALLFRPLPVQDPDRLVTVTTSYRDNPYNPTSYADFRDLRDYNEVFSGMAAYFFFPMSLKGNDQPEVVTGQLITWNFFDLLGVQPAMGRSFLPEEEQLQGGPLVAILSDRFWRTRFDADPEIVGKKILLNARPFEVVGVAPKGFFGINTVVFPDVWVPVMTVGETLPYPIDLNDRYSSWLALVGRLKPGLTLEQAQAGMDLVANNINDQTSTDPQYKKSFTLTEADRVRVGLHEPNDAMRKSSLMLMCLVGLVLLIACFNVANLLLARATQRQQEIAVRLSLGAPRWRVLRQLLVESLLLSLVAAAVGLLFALWGLELLLATIPEVPGFLIEIDATPDARVLGFGLLLALVSAVVFGLAPGLQMIRSRPLTALQDQSRGATRSRKRSYLQDILVATQVAVSVILLVTASLFLRSLRNANHVDPGFELHDGLVLELDLGFGQYSESEGRQFYDRLARQIRTVPGVETAALAVDMPLSQMHIQSYLLVDGYEPRADERMVMRINMVGSGYFEALGIPIVEGRAFSEQDRQDGARVAVINQTMARRYWAGRNPIGSFVRKDDQRWQVVGIAKDGKYDSLDEQPKPFAYFPLEQSPYVKRLNLIVGTVGEPETVIAPVVNAVRTMDANLPPPRTLTMEQFMASPIRSAGGPGDLILVFGLLALALAMIGVYGVMSYSVSRRTHEFGIRVALGAKRTQILGLVLRRGLAITVGGLVVGLAAAYAAARLLQEFFFEVSLFDPTAIATVTVLLGAAAMAACYFPARWASRVDPSLALRQE